MNRTWQFLLASVAAALLGAGTTAAAPEFNCSGTVTDAAGHPLAGVTVEYWRYDPDPFGANVPELQRKITTETNGAFAFQVSRAAGVLLARKPGLAPAWQQLNQPFEAEPDEEVHLVLTPTAALAGVVVDEAAKPVANAEVSAAMASCETPDEEGVRTYRTLSGKLAHDCFAARTDAAGHFRIENFPANATAALAVQAAGKAVAPSERNFTNGASLPWRAGQTDINLAVEPAGGMEGKIIVEGSNQPPPVARLMLEHDGPGNFPLGQSEPVASGADGTFHFSDVAAGSYRIRAAFGTNAMTEWVAETVPVSVDSGQTTRGVEVKAVPGGLLEVTVLGENDGKPVAEVKVNAYQENVPYAAISDSNGVARLRLPPGDYEVSASSESMTEGQTSASVEAGQTNQLEIELVPPQKITGLIRQPDGRPAAGIRVRIISGIASGAGGVKTGADGKFELTWTQRRLARYDTSACILARDVEHNLSVAQEIDEDTGPLDLTLAPSLTLTGRVESDGQPVTNVSAALIFWTGRIAAHLGELSRGTNTPGRFEINALPPGRRYGIVVSAPGYGQKTVNDLNGSEEAGRVEQDTVELLPANLQLAGQVVDEDDKPIFGVNVQLTGEGQPNGSTTTDRQGRFHFQVCEGMVRLLANGREGGFAQTSAEAGDTNIVLQLGQNNMSAYGPATHKLKGTVTDADGKPVAGAQMAVFSAFQFNGVSWKRTATNGTFSLAWSLQPYLIQSGGALLLVRDPAHKLGAAKVLEEETTNLDIKLKPAMTLTGLVKKADDSPLAGAHIKVQLKTGNTYGDFNETAAPSDAQGHFEINGLPPDATYLVFVSLKGYGQSQQPVRVESATNAVELLPFVLRPTDHVLAGQVRNDDDKPVAGVSVSYSGLDQPNGSTITDRQGRFHLQVCEGMVNLNANGQGGSGRISAEGGDTNVVLYLGQYYTTDLNAKPHKLKGSVTDPDGKPVAGAQVAMFQGFLFNGLRWKKTATNGEFNFTWTPRPAQRLAGGATLLVARDPARNLAASERVEEATTNLSLKLKPAVTLTGLVKNEDGSPIAGAQLNVQISTGNGYGQLNDQIAFSDAQGRYHFKCLPPEESYVVATSAKGHGKGRLEVPGDFATNLVELSPVILPQAKFLLAGQVLNEKNKPVSGAMVSFSGQGQPNGNMTTDRKGQFHFQVCDGQINLFANSLRGGGFAQGTAEAGDTNVVLTLGAARAMGAMAAMAVAGQAVRRVTRAAAPLVSLKGSPLPDLASVSLASNAAPGGQAVLLCLFDAGQRPSRQVMRQLNEQAAALRDQSVTVLGVQALITGGEIFNQWKSENPVSFPLGRVTEKSNGTKWVLGIQTLPWLILTDARHKVVAEGFALDDLDTELKKLPK